ncbi:MAG TPA: nitronate monooxygenase [Pseudonocardiaceae bacterium]
MIRTPVCDLLGIDVPIVQAAFGPLTSVQLSAAVSNARALGSLGAAARPLHQLEPEWRRMRELTDRPFAINHTTRPLDEEAFAASLRVQPAVISMALGDPGDRVARVHDAGIVFMQQVHTVVQAERAAALGVDVIIAQGAEAGGFCGTVGTLPLVPQVVDAVRPVPVLAAGGIADGRGLAAVLALGAQGVNIGTRFLAATETTISASWQRAIIQAGSEDTVRADFVNVLLPTGAGGFATAPRTLHTPFVDEWLNQADQAAAHAEELRGQVLNAAATGTVHELLPFTGQSAGLIHDVRPARDIIAQLLAEATQALAAASRSLIGEPTQG